MSSNRALKFIAAYKRTGQVKAAARLAKIDRSAHYRRLRADPDYRKLFEEADQDASLELEDKVVRWAFEGFEEPVIYQGQLCFPPDAYEKDPENPKKLRLKPGAKPLTRVRGRSEALAMFLLKAKLPQKYKSRELPPAPVDDGRTTWEEFIQVYRRTTDPGADAMDRTYPPDKRSAREGQWSSDAAPPPSAE